MTVRPAKTHVSLGIHSVWSESSLCAQWVAKGQNFLQADSEDSDQTGRMPSLSDWADDQADPCLRLAHISIWAAALQNQ